MTAKLEKEEGLNPLRLTPLAKAHEILGRRTALRRIVKVAHDPAHLNLHWAADAKGGQGGFVIEPVIKGLTTVSGDETTQQDDGDVTKFLRKHKRMELTDTAVQSIMHHADLSLPEAIRPTMLPPAFVASIRSKMDKMKGLNLITGGGSNDTRVVEAFAPGKMNPISDQHLVDHVLTRIADRWGDQIRGVRFNSFGGESVKRYSIIFGEKGVLTEGGDPLKTTWPAIDVFADDLGLGPTSLTLGLYRVICVNMALSSFWTAGQASWNRLGNSEGFMNKANKVIDIAGRFAAHTAKALNEANGRGIPDGEEVVNRLRSKKVISTAHAEAALDLVARDDPQTEFDMFQVMTDSAKNLTANAQREAQGKAVAILMGGGFKHVCLKGLDKDQAEKEMATCLA